MLRLEQRTSKIKKKNEQNAAELINAELVESGQISIYFSLQYPYLTPYSKLNVKKIKITALNRYRLKSI